MIDRDKKHPMYETWGDEIQRRYDQGVLWLETMIDKDQLYPKDIWEEADIDVNSELLIHNYTGACPTLTYEVSPVEGCHIGCLYCLVTDGHHQKPLTLYRNYDQLITNYLKKHHEKPHYYYFSAKTEAIQKPTLESGMVHKILGVFIDHYKEYPDSKARLFIASKAGIKDLEYKVKDVSVLDLFGQLQGKMQFNTSISMMPDALQKLLEPNAAPMSERLEAVRACQKVGIHAKSALIQPILPFMVENQTTYLEDYFSKLKSYGINNYKPEFLTACVENVAAIGLLLREENVDLETALYEAYFTMENIKHVKQRSRMAPKKALSKTLFKEMKTISDAMGISTSICYWVRESLDISEEMIPLINENGYQCLGYQRHLFGEESDECI